MNRRFFLLRSHERGRDHSRMRNRRGHLSPGNQYNRGRHDRHIIPKCSQRYWNSL